MQSSAPVTTATDTFTKLKFNFNICITDISTAPATSTSCKGIHLYHPRDTDACKQGQPNEQQQESRGQPNSLLVVDDQQTGPSKPLDFTLMLTKHFNPPSVASATGEESQRNMSGLSSFFGHIPSVLSRLTHCSRFHQLTHNHQPPVLQPPPTHSKNISSYQSSLSLLHSQPTPNSSCSRTTAIASNQSFSGPLL